MNDARDWRPGFGQVDSGASAVHQEIPTLWKRIEGSGKCDGCLDVLGASISNVGGGAWEASSSAVDGESAVKWVVLSKSCEV